MSEPKVILVTGATGSQGGAVVDALLASPERSQFTILGLTRNPESEPAKKLAAKSPAIKIIKGDYADIPALFKSAREVTSQPVWGVYSVQVARGKGASPEKEEKDGKELADESIRQGVKYYVQSTVDRGGDEKSWTNPTYIPHFISKHNIELHLRDEAAKDGGKMQWCILRPTAFMDAIQPGFGLKIFMAAWRETLQDKPLQMIAVQDIGRAAARAFTSPQQYAGKAVGLAGDEVTFQQVEDIFKQKLGHGTGATYGFLGNALLWGVKELRVMMNWFKTDGYGVDIPRLRQVDPQLMDFGTWLETKSTFPKK
jgi:uncharacterized protein YbjT (DUF2867 family)